MTEKNSKNGNFRLILLAVFVGVISAVAGISLWNVMQNAPRSSDSTLLVLPEPRVIADFALTDDSGSSFSLDDLRGQWSLVFFGFTHCPDVCPTALYELKQVHEKLAGRNGGETPEHRVLFVSVDPERDTPEKLHDYVSYFHPDFTGVTGPHEQLEPLTMQLGIAYRIEPHEDGVPYDVNHSASVQLINPRGQLHGVFPAPHDAGKMARELSAVMQ
jgi:protein SCO1/2